MKRHAIALSFLVLLAGCPDEEEAPEPPARTAETQPVPELRGFDPRAEPGVTEDRDDRLMFDIMRRHLRPDSNTVDVGTWKGTHLAFLEHVAPLGTHFGFEPLPGFFRRLQEVFADSTGVRLFETALGDEPGEATFHHVVDHPAYSGFDRRPQGGYPEEEPDIEVITVQVDTLDRIVPEDLRIDLVKIDVEGAELSVLRGGLATLRRWRPLIFFEHGVPGPGPHEKTEGIIQLISDELDMHFYRLEDYLSGAPPMTLEELRREVYSNRIWNFVAAAEDGN